MLSKVFVTHSHAPSNASADGNAPAGIGLLTSPVTGSIDCTLRLPKLVTHSRDPSEANACGRSATAIGWLISPVNGSID